MLSRTDKVILYIKQIHRVITFENAFDQAKRSFSIEAARRAKDKLELERGILFSLQREVLQ